MISLKSKKILLTGASGFIGSYLGDSLIKDGCDVTLIDRKLSQDLCDSSFVDNLDDHDIIIHLAAFNGTKHFYEQPFNVVIDNTLPTLNLLKRFAGKSSLFVFAGTCESYANTVSKDESLIPTPEDIDLSIGDLFNPRWSYGGSKIGNEISVIAAHNQFNQNFMILRYHNIYGINQKDHFFSEFMQRCIQKKYELYGYTNTRSFLHINDAVEITKSLIESSDAVNEIINVGSDTEMSIQEIGEIILKELGIDASELKLYDAPKGSINRRAPCTKKLNKILGDKSFKLTSIEKGIKEMVEHYGLSKK